MANPRPTSLDLHTHILPPSWPDLADRFGYPGWIALDPCSHQTATGGQPCCARMLRDGRNFRTVQRNCWDPATRLEEIDRLSGPGAAQALSTVPVMFSYWAKPADALFLSQLLNDHIAGICRDHPASFFGLGTVPLQDPDLACRELERCVRDLGLRGIQIGTHVEANRFVNGGAGRKDDWNLNEPALFPVFQTAARLNAAVFVHPWDMMGTAQMERYWLPWLVGMPAETSRAICSVIFGGVLERLPTLRIGFAHGGGSFPGTIGRIQHGFEARPDLCAIDNSVPPRAYLTRTDAAGRAVPARFYVDSLTHDPDTLRALLRLMGPQRIALGSDYPFPLGEAEPGRMIREMLDLDEATRERLLVGTALEFLGFNSTR